MRTKTFISLMLVLLLFTAGLMAFASSAAKEEQKKECPAGSSCSDDSQVQAADGMIWETVSKHLISAVQ